MCKWHYINKIMSFSEILTVSEGIDVYSCKVHYVYMKGAVFYMGKERIQQ